MGNRIAVVIPCFRVKPFILNVIHSIPQRVEKIFVIDDACPDRTGQYVKDSCTDPRVEIIFNSVNTGVGGAVIQGYKRAIAEGFSIIVKIDGDGQMDPSLIGQFVAPIEQKQADYTKGNRFYDRQALQTMPKSRLLCNAILSFVTKFSSGYWNCLDPANGFTAISTSVLKRLPLDTISQRYFFESDMLYHLNGIRAVVLDVPAPAVYRNEVSNLRIAENIWPFIKGNGNNFCKRILYSYFLGTFSMASLQLLAAMVLILFGLIFGGTFWIHGTLIHEPATAGTVMVAALPIIIGMQLLVAFLSYDIHNVPKQSLISMMPHE